MSGPGHEDAPHFPVAWGKYPRATWMLNALSASAHRNRPTVIVLLILVFIAGVAAVREKVGNSIVHTIERVGKSAELRGRLFTGTAQPQSSRIRDDTIPKID
jgi:hypothetical protein